MGFNVVSLSVLLAREFMKYYCKCSRGGGGLSFWVMFIYNASLEHYVQCHLAGPCILFLQPYSNLCVHIDLSDIVLYEPSGLIVCSNNNTHTVRVCPLMIMTMVSHWLYSSPHTPHHHPYHHLSRLLVSGIRLPTNTCVFTSVDVRGD